MLSTLGRGLASTPMRPTTNNVKKFIFTNSLPADVTFTRNSQATCRNAEGKLIIVNANEARIDHYADGTTLGLFLEHSSTNKCQNTNVNPTTTAGLSTSGTGTLSVVSDTAELLAAGLDQICTNGNVFKAEATSGSDFIVSIDGATGNTNAHSITLHARGEGTGDAARIALGGTELNIAPAGDNYSEYKHENLTPASSSQKFTIIVNGNNSVYFILNQLEEGEDCTSIIPIAGSAVTRSTDRARVLNVDQADWFDATQGHMICRYTLNKLISSDVYLSVLNDGTSTDTIGYRISGSSKDLKGFTKAGGANLFTLGNQDYHLAKVMNTGGLRWNSSQTDLISGANIATGSLSNTPSGINELAIGSRNGGSGPMTGHITSIEIGNKDITIAKLGNFMHKAADTAIAAAGQSLARGFFNSQESNSDIGKQKIRQLISNAYKDNAVILIDGSTSASSASKTSNATNYWWDLATQARGPAFDNFYQEINDTGTIPTKILWAQGEEDSHSINTATTKAQYKDSLEAIFSNMRQTLGNIEIYIQRIGRRASFSNTGGLQIVRDVQNEVIAENSWCHETCEIYDLNLFDDVHLTDAGYLEAAERSAMVFLGQSGSYGPSISNASRDGNIITITITHDAGDDFTPASNIEGFVFFDDTSEISITSAIKVNSDTITLTLSSTPSSANQILYYGYDAMLGLNINNVVRDNATPTMPLRTSALSKK